MKTGKVLTPRSFKTKAKNKAEEKKCHGQNRYEVPGTGAAQMKSQFVCNSCNSSVVRK